MKDIEIKANGLIEFFWTEIEDNDYQTRKMSFNQATQCAIQSVNHTIEVLEKVKDDISDFWYKGNVIVAINEQIELKKILEGRL